MQPRSIQQPHRKDLNFTSKYEYPCRSDSLVLLITLRKDLNSGEMLVGNFTGSCNGNGYNGMGLSQQWVEGVMSEMMTSQGQGHVGRFDDGDRVWQMMDGW